MHSSTMAREERIDAQHMTQLGCGKKERNRFQWRERLDGDAW
jgi:hypothetical protein